MAKKQQQQSNQLREAFRMLAWKSNDNSVMPSDTVYVDEYDQFATNLRDRDTAKLRPIDCVNQKHGRKP